MRNYYPILLFVAVMLAGLTMVGCDDAEEFSVSTKAPKGVKAIDLGLSVKWANMNVGANSPEDYGNHYAWGETSPKQEYDEEHYKYCKVLRGFYTDEGFYECDINDEYYEYSTPYDFYTKYCFDPHDGYKGFVDYKMTLEPMDDAATVNWGKAWRMPTKEEFQELNDKCMWTWKTLNGRNGFEVKGPNGKTIFLPAAGYRSNNSDTHYEHDKLCAYWTSTLRNIYGETWNAWIYFRDWEGYIMKGRHRSSGRSVRPVCD